MKTTQKGFALEGLLIVIILAIVGGTGFYVWHSKNATDNTYNSAANSQKNVALAPIIKTFADCNKANGSKVQESYPAVCVTKGGKSFTQSSTPITGKIKQFNVDSNGEKFKLYNVRYIAKTDDQINIAKALKTQCVADYKSFKDPTPPNQIYAVAQYTKFENNQDYKVVGGFAKLSDVICENLANFISVTDLGGGYVAINKSDDIEDAGPIYVLKKQNESWRVLFSENGTNDCKDRDGLGLPSAFGERCIDGSNSRLAKP